MKEGQTIGQYRLLEQVGKGGMAEVFQAEQTLPDGSLRTVAIKRLFPRLAADREFVGMFVNEARIASSMVHPNIIRTFDLINSGSYYYIVMEFLAGMDLEDLIALSPPEHMAVSLHEAAFVVHDVALGLGYAHRGGSNLAAGPVVHRDISPGNILLDCTGRVLVTDFGIARAAQYAQATRPGILKGKYDYMAPEYVAGKDFDGRADLFSLGVVFYELLTGKNPFADVMPQDIWDKILKYDPPPPSQLAPEVPRAIDAIVASALRKDPRERIPSGEVFAQMLQPFFSRAGRRPVQAVLGERVARSMSRPRECDPQAAIAAFLPPEELDLGDRTQEIHLDELLELVEPQDVPRPDFAVLASDQTVPKAPTVRRRRWRQIQPWWIAVAVGVLAVGAAAAWWLWPRPTGSLSVTSDRRAEIYVDEQRMGLAPIHDLALAPGKHVVEARRPGTNQVKRYELVIQADERSELPVRWSRPVSKKKMKNKKVRPKRRSSKKRTARRR
jgi:serine/threonine-protein kinase